MPTCLWHNKILRNVRKAFSDAAGYQNENDPRFRLVPRTYRVSHFQQIPEQLYREPIATSTW